MTVINQGKYPLFLWGDAQNFDTQWTKVDSVAVTTGVTDIFGGANAYTLNDASNSAFRYIKRAVSLTLGTIDFPVWFIVDTANSTTADGLISFYDTVATAHIRTCKIHITGGVVTLVNVTGTATSDLVISLGSGFYLCRVMVVGITAANAAEIWIAPAATTVSDTASEGTLTLYMRSLCVLGRPLEDPTAYSVQRRGYTTAEISSGIEDAFDYGEDEILEARSIRIFGTEQVGDEAGSGWDGQDEYPGMNCGIKSLLRAGRLRKTVRFVPDRASSSVYIDSYLRGQEGRPDTDRWVPSGYGLVALRSVVWSLKALGSSPFVGF